MTAGTLVAHRAHTVAADQACLGSHLLVVGDEHTAFAGGDVLVGEEAERGTVADGSEFLAFVLRQRAVAGILNHLEVVLAGNRHNLVHSGRETSHMNHHNALGLGRNLTLDVSGIDIDMVGPHDIGKDGSSTHITDAVAGGSKGQRWADHLIAGAEAAHHTRHVERVGAVRHAHRILHAPHINKHLLQLRILRTSADPARLDGIIRCLSLALVEVQIKKRNFVSHNIFLTFYIF